MSLDTPKGKIRLTQSECYEYDVLITMARNLSRNNDAIIFVVQREQYGQTSIEWWISDRVVNLVKKMYP